MFSVLGRILLAIACGLLLYSGITGVINGNNAIAAVGGWGAVTAEGYWQAVFSFCFALLNIVLALPALFGVIRGRCGFWMFVFAVLLGIGAGITIYNKATAGELNSGTAVWNVVLSLLTPLTYALGTIFILLRRRGNAN